MDIMGMALLDYQNGKYTEDIITYSSLDEQDIIPLPHFFRRFHEMPAIEQKALKLCRGTILDIGCGAGSHSLYLQEENFEVTALDNSKGAIETCRQRGIRNVHLENFYDFKGERFDTVLLLMNGLGLAEKLDRLDRFLSHIKTLINQNGQVIVDSSDIIYMFDEDEDGGRWLPDTKGYYGEVEFVMEYKGEKSDPFWWLYCDFNTLERAATANALNCELIIQGEHYDYLARLTPK
ncbi:class I SAM-dependent methyltransferase [Maribacter algicola]|uniref:Class I SAM-dependent methyltransferase n=1 Tax=Meishania litoralis TaxID=3434685 RepID=A0ACC7LG96_9FLAO